jgi:hypothetical protein
LFNTISNNHLGQMSPLLECRQCGNSTNSSAPVFNFNIPNDVFHMFKPPASVPVTPLQATAPALVTPIAHIPPQLSVTETLVSANRVPGPELSLDEFCRMYRLTDGIRNKLDENGYSGTHTFPYAEWKDVKDVGLKPGEIAQLKHTISVWSTAQAL